MRIMIHTRPHSHTRTRKIPYICGDYDPIDCILTTELFGMAGSRHGWRLTCARALASGLRQEYVCKFAHLVRSEVLACARVQVRSCCVVLACACSAARRRVARGSTRPRTCLDAFMCMRASTQHIPRAQLASARVRELRDFVLASGHHASLSAKCSSTPRAPADH